MTKVMMTVLLAVLALPVMALERDELQRVHAEAVEQFSDEQPTMRVEHLPGNLFNISDGYLSSVYQVLDDMGAEPEIVIVRITANEMRHIVTCASGLCFDPDSPLLIPEDELNRNGLRVVKTGKMAE